MWWCGVVVRCGDAVWWWQVWCDGVAVVVVLVVSGFGGRCGECFE